MNAKPILTVTEIEAVTHFIAERKELWDRHAKDFGVTDPDRLPQELVRAHRKAIQQPQP